MKSTRQDRAMIAAGILMMATFGILLWKEDDLRLSFSSSEPGIAEVIRVNEDVRGRPASEFSWFRMGRGQSVTKGMSLFTGPGSAVTLKMKDGSEIEIGENSLVYFQMDQKQLKLDLRYGNIRGDSQILVESEGKLSQLTRQFLPQPKRRVARSVVPKPIERKPAMEEQATTGFVGPLEAPILDSIPSTVILPEMKNIVIQWASVQGADSYIVETSKRADFAKVKSQVVDAPRATVVFKDPGLHYVRVRATSRTAKVGLGPPSVETGVTAIYRAAKMKIPATVEKMGKATDEVAPEVKVGFQLETPIPDAPGLEVIIRGPAADGISKILKPGEDPNILFPGPGEFEVQTRALDQKGVPIQQLSAPVSISYVYRKPLSTPVIEWPKNKSTVFIQSGANTMPVLWTAVEQAERYVIQAAADIEFKNVIREVESSQNATRFPAANWSGVLVYLRVKAQGDKGRESDWSQPQDIQLSGRPEERLILDKP